MGGVAVVEFVSLDGVMQAPGHSAEDVDGDFAHGGWTAPYFDDHRTLLLDMFRECGGFLLGRRTYEIFAEFWPTVTDPADEIAGALNGRPKYVVSRTLRDPAWANTKVLGGEFAPSVRSAAAAQDGDLLVIGSSALVHGLQGAGLVDRWEMLLHPVVLGSGKRLFAPAGAPTTWQLGGVRSTERGIVALSYAALR